MSRKCILILVDGMRPDALSACGHPFYNAFLAGGAVQLAGRSVMPSVTLPCHISLFHSVPPQRHGTLTNTYAQQVRPVKSLFEVLHDAGKQTAMFYNWEQLRDVSLPGCLDYSNLMSLYAFQNSDTRLTQACIAHLKDSAPDFTFLYLGETDEAGHADGWLSPFYLKTLNNAWECIARIAEACGDEYDLILTADHGGHDRCHGTEQPEDMNIPILLRLSGEKTLRSGVTSACLTDLAPTVAALLDVPAARDWEGTALV